MVATSIRMNASSLRMPKCWITNSNSTSQPVISTPQRIGNAEQQVQPDGRAEHLGQIAGGDGDFAQPEQDVVDRRRIIVVAGLGQVAAGDKPQPGAEGLKQHGHHVAHQQHPDEPVAELRAALDVGGPIAGVHVADRDEIGRPGKREQPPPPPAGGDRNRSVNFFQRSFVVPAVGRS